ncbi:MAG: hypothetical protein Q7U04_04570 [Bacteriovorax sp.]|nr:hypothetical protein [Bacteriovorax sp.]
MQLKSLFLVTILSAMSFQAWSLENTLCLVSSDLDNDYGKIVYQMDQDNREILHLYQESYHDGKLSGRIELNAQGLQEGIVLNRKDKYITVRMHSDNYDPERGGVLYLDTLYSGVSGERREYAMELGMDKEGPVLVKDKVKFEKMKFIAKRSKVFGVIGVERVVFGD